MTHYSTLCIDPDDIHDEYDRADFADLSDTQLFDLGARAIAVPRGPAANSFVLHAPLELMARRLLLPLVPPGRRRAVRERMISVAATYEVASESVEPPLVTGPLSTALDEMQASIDLTGGDPDVGTEFLGYSALVRSTINRSMAYSLMGRLDEARADAESGLAEARRRAELENVVIGLYAMNLWSFMADEATDALARAREPIQVMEMSTRYLHTYAWEGMGMACLLVGRPDEAIRALESGPAFVGEGVGGFQQASTLALLSAAYAAAGDARRSFDFATEAVEVVRVRGTRVYAGHALLRRAHARRLLGQEESLVAEDLALARAAIEETGAYGYLPFLEAAQLRRRTGR